MPCNIGAAKEVRSTYQSHTTILVPNFTSALIAALAQVLPHLGVLRSEELTGFITTGVTIGAALWLMIRRVMQGDIGVLGRGER